MRKAKKLLSLLLVCVLLFTMSYTAFAAAAEAVTDVSVSLCADKKNYTSGDEIKLTTKIKNNTGFKQYVSVVYMTTPFVKMSSADRHMINYAELEDGAAKEFNLTATAKRNVFESAKVQKVYDAVCGSFWSAIYMVAYLFSNNLEAVRVNVDGVPSVVLAEFSSSLTAEGETPVEPVDPVDPVDPIEPVDPVVPMDIKIDQSSCETTNNSIALTGTFSCTGLQTISYMVDPFFYETGSSETGEVIIDGNKWSTTVALKPGSNNINVTVTDTKGETKTAKITVKYNIGESYTFTENDVSFDQSEGINYVNNIIVIFFKKNTSAEKIDEVVRYMNGEYAGVNYALNSYQIKVAASDLETLYGIADDLAEKYDCIIFADIDQVSSTSIAVNDPWNGDVDENDWNDDDVDGSNWGIEAIEAQKAWDYANRFSEVNIGVVDNGFSVNHPDFSRGSINVLSIEDSVEESDHGTHVAGIIGAAANNSTGMTGVMYNKANLLCYDALFSGNEFFSDSEIESGFSFLVQSGAKAVNFSLGSSANLENNNSRKTTRSINSEGRRASLAIATLLDAGFDFVVVQSAGNGASDGIGVDAINNGRFCCVTESNCSTVGDVTVNDVMNRIIIVSAAEQNGNGYKLTSFSNAGAQATIAAPGSAIYSTFRNTYASWDGTSMAAPFVTGVAGLIWSVNEDFSGADVKDIIVSTARDTVFDNLESPNTTGDMRLINAKLAVEEAIKRTDGDGALTFRVLDAADGYPVVNNAKLVCKSYDGYSTVNIVNKEYSPVGNKFNIKLPAGKYVFELSAPSYISLTFEVEITSDKTTDLGVIVLSKSVNENEVRVVLTWRNEPSDIDSHFNGITTSNSDYHVYYSSRGSSNMAWLDVDDVDYDGPETITIDMTKFKSFTYSVHNYSHHDEGPGDGYELELAQSGAMVTVYVKDEIVAFIDVPTNRAGTAWHVFTMNSNKEITDISTYATSWEYDYSGGSTVGSKYRINPNSDYD